MAAEQGSDVQAWLDGLEERVSARAEDMARIVRGADPRLEQAMRWGRLTFTVGGNWHHWLCGIAATKKATKLVFHKGALLDDPEGLLVGSGRYTREVPAEDVRRCPDAVRVLVRNAIAHQTDMVA